jgi:SAM-dependent methyltransferase
MIMPLDLPIPPKDLRLWVGPFEDELIFLRSGMETATLLQDMVKLRPEDVVFDIGCGSGRVALGLVNYLTAAGRYLGIDASLAPIRWCQQNITPRFPNFRFEHLDVYHPGYAPDGQTAPEHVTFPAPSSSFDVALLSSVFTHLLPAQVDAYTRETVRVLRPGGRCLISYLLMNDAAVRAVAAATTIFDFRYWHGPCVTFAPDSPTEGLAYQEDYALAALRAAGLIVEEIRYGDWRTVRSFEVQHDWVTATKPEEATDRPRTNGA